MDYYEDSEIYGDLSDVQILSRAPTPTPTRIATGVELVVIDDGPPTSRIFSRPAGTIHVRRVMAQYTPANNEFVLACPVVSRAHAQLSWSEEGEMHLMDCGSHHGTYLTKKGKAALFKLPPAAPTLCSDGDTITFGKAVSKGGARHDPVRVSVHFIYDPIPSGRYGLVSEASTPIRESSFPYDDGDHERTRFYDTSNSSTPNVRSESLVLLHHFDDTDSQIGRLKSSDNVTGRTKKDKTINNLDLLHRVEGIATDVRSLMEAEADVAALRQQLATLLSTNQADKECLLSAITALKDELNNLRVEHQLQVQRIPDPVTPETSSPRKRKREEEESEDEETPIRGRRIFSPVSLAVVVGGAAAWYGLSM